MRRHFGHVSQNVGAPCAAFLYINYCYLVVFDASLEIYLGMFVCFIHRVITYRRCTCIIMPRVTSRYGAVCPTPRGPNLPERRGVFYNGV